MARALRLELEPLPPPLEALAEQLAELAPSERRAVARVVESRVKARQPTIRPISAARLLTGRGLVALGGDAVEDTLALYDA